jgi:putative methionine-R-sulfoxide reductase with GAF domain
MRENTNGNIETNKSGSSNEKYLSTEELEEILFYFSTSIHHLSSEEDIAWDVVRNCISKMHFSDCVIYFVDWKKRELVQTAAHGPKNPRDFDIVKPLNIRIGDGISGTVALNGVAEIIPDTTMDPRYITDDERRLSEIAVPIKSDGVVIGVIDCEHPDSNFFTRQHLRLLNAIASFYGIRVSKLRAERREERERNRLIAAEKGMAKMRLQVLNTQMSPHFLFNSINAIQHFIITDDKKPALNYLSVFSKLIRKFLSNLDQDSITVAEEVEMLKLYLELQMLRYSLRFGYQLEIDPEGRAADARIPPLIVHSLVENFLEAMISQNKGSSAITLKFKIEQRDVHFDMKIEALESGEFSNHLPQYREGLAQWSDHVETYNRIRKYDMIYSIQDILNEDKSLVGRWVQLSMPNIA